MTVRSVPLRNALAMLLLAAALSMRVLVPQGWMPDAQAESIFAVMPCPDQGSVPFAPDHETHGHGDHHGPMAAMDHGGADEGADGSAHGHDHPAEPCSFAGLALAALSGDDGVVVPDRLPFAEHFDRARSDAVVLARQRALPPARGPPLTV